MKVLTVGNFKADFSSVLDLIRKGESVGLSYGKSKKPLAVLTPFKDFQKRKPIKLGLLEGKASVKFADDFKMTDEEFLNS